MNGHIIVSKRFCCASLWLGWVCASVPIGCAGEGVTDGMPAPGRMPASGGAAADVDGAGHEAKTSSGGDGTNGSRAVPASTTTAGEAGAHGADGDASSGGPSASSTHAGHGGTTATSEGATETSAASTGGGGEGSAGAGGGASDSETDSKGDAGGSGGFGDDAGDGSVGDAGGSGGFGGEPAGSGCDPEASFSEISDEVFAVPGLVRPRLSSDELVVYYSEMVDGSSWDIGTGERSTRDEPFTDLRPVEGVNGTRDDLTPFLSSDGLTLFFESARSGNYKIYSASRNNTEAAFGVPALLRNVSEGVDYPSGGPYLSADDQTLYFQMVTPSGQDLYQSIRNLTAWSEPGLVFSATQSVAFPVVTSDELRLYIAVYDPSSNWNIWTATRTARNEPFSNGTPVAELNSEEAEFPAWLSPDGCRLYFDRGSDWKQSVVHVAERR